MTQQKTHLRKRKEEHGPEGNEGYCRCGYFVDQTPGAWARHRTEAMTPSPTPEQALAAALDSVTLYWKERPLPDGSTEATLDNERYTRDVHAALAAAGFAITATGERAVSLKKALLSILDQRGYFEGASGRRFFKKYWSSLIDDAIAFATPQPEGLPEKSRTWSTTNANDKCNCPESGTSGSCPYHDAWTKRPDGAAEGER